MLPKISYAMKFIKVLKPLSFLSLCLNNLFGAKGWTSVYSLWNGAKVRLRDGTSDILTLGEIYIRKVYHDVKEIEDPVVIDLGAHIGIFSVKCAKEGAKVYAYEPDRENYLLLSENIEINRMSEDIRAFNFAVTKKRGTIKFYPVPDESSGSIFNKTPSLKPEEVMSVKLEDVFIDNSIKHCHLLKMDIENAEYEVLRTAPKWVLNRIDRIDIELHRFDQVIGELKNWDGKEELKKILKDAGFRIEESIGSDKYSSSYLYAYR